MTEFDFTLPHGLTVNQITHRQGIMRLATARDEITAQNDLRVKDNPAYAVLIYLSLVIIKIGDISNITPQLLEDLSVLDLAYLREFYNCINQHREAHISLQCPHCQQQLKVELALAGE